MASNDIIIGHWRVRGRAGPIRTLLAYCNIPFQNRFYDDGDEWFAKDKEGLGIEYANLPYLIDGDKKVAESQAVLQYIVIKSGKKELRGDTDDKFIQVKMAFGVAEELRTRLSDVCWTKGNFEAEKEEGFTKGKIGELLASLNRNLEKKEWICGFLSLADFMLFEAVELGYNIDAGKFDKYPNLVGFMKRFNEIPQIKEFKKSDKFEKLWFTVGMATWTNSE